MTCREEILQTVNEVIRDSGTNSFTVAEVLGRMQAKKTKYLESTIRTHITSSMCRNAPPNHFTRYPHFERIGMGTYRLIGDYAGVERKAAKQSREQRSTKKAVNFPVEGNSAQQELILINGRQYLENMGFQQAGHWELIEDKLKLSLSSHKDASPALYAFLLGDEVLYIGKTARQVGRRLYMYQRPGLRQRTNIRNHKSLVELLSQVKKIDIWVWSDESISDEEDLYLDKAAGYESSLIRKLNPKWNLRK